MNRIAMKPFAKKDANMKGFVYTFSALLLLMMLMASSLAIFSIASPGIEIHSFDPELQSQIYQSIMIGAAVSATLSDAPDLSAKSYIDKSFESLALLNDFKMIQNDGGLGEGAKLPEMNHGNAVYIFKRAYDPQAGGVAHFRIPDGHTLAVFGIGIFCMFESNGTEIAVDLHGSIGKVTAAVYSGSLQSWSYRGILSDSNVYVAAPSLTNIETEDQGHAGMIMIAGLPVFSLIEASDEGGGAVFYAIKGKHSEYAIASPIGQQLPFNGSLHIRAPLAVEEGIEGGYAYVLY